MTECLVRTVLALALATGLTGARAAAGDIDTYRSVQETKAEVIRRTEQNIYPMSGLDPADVREAVKDIKTLKRDEWAHAFVQVGDKYFQRAQGEVSKDKGQARKDYLAAQKLYYFGRWPAPLDSPERSVSYRKEREAFLAGARLGEFPVEAVQADFNGHEVPGLLSVPKGATQAPLVVIVGGLDGWKEVRLTQFSYLMSKGVALLSLDMPGTGESPVKLEKGAEQSLLAVMDKVLARGDIDPGRVVVYGGSFGGYWSTLLAVNAKDRIKGAVDHSGPYDETFHRDTFSKVMKGNEYLYDVYPAMLTLLRNVNTEEEFFAAFERQSLKAQGYNNKPTADLLVLGGQLDTLVPPDDLLQVLSMPGGIKEAWINPAGVHMGRDRTHGFTDADINRRWVFPWILRRFGMTAD